MTKNGNQPNRTIHPSNKLNLRATRAHVRLNLLVVKQGLGHRTKRSGPRGRLAGVGLRGRLRPTLVPLGSHGCLKDDVRERGPPPLPALRTRPGQWHPRAWLFPGVLECPDAAQVGHPAGEGGEPPLPVPPLLGSRHQLIVPVVLTLPATPGVPLQQVERGGGRAGGAPVVVTPVQDPGVILVAAAG